MSSGQPSMAGTDATHTPATEQETWKHHHRSARWARSVTRTHRQTGRSGCSRLVARVQHTSKAAFQTTGFADRPASCKQCVCCVYAHIDAVTTRVLPNSVMLVRCHLFDAALLTSRSECLRGRNSLLSVPLIKVCTLPIVPSSLRTFYTLYIVYLVERVSGSLLHAFTSARITAHCIALTQSVAHCMMPDRVTATAATSLYHRCSTMTTRPVPARVSSSDVDVDATRQASRLSSA